MTPSNKKKPAVAVTFGEKLEIWYDNNGKLINVALAVIVLGVIGFRAYQWMQAGKTEKANLAYSTAVDHFNEAAQNPDDAKKQDQLQGAISAAKQVTAAYPNQFVGREAQLLIANAQYGLASMQSGQDDAVKTLEKSRDNYKKYISVAANNDEKAAGYIALGNVLENLSFIRSDMKVLQEAVDAYTEAASAGEGTYLGGEARLALARAKSALANKGATTDAIKLYEEVKKNRDVQLVSDATIKKIKPLEMESGQTLSKEEIVDMKNMATWSQRQAAEDALNRLK